MASLLKYCLTELKMLPSEFIDIDDKEKALVIALIESHSQDLKNIRKGGK